MSFWTLSAKKLHNTLKHYSRFSLYGVSQKSRIPWGFSFPGLIHYLFEIRTSHTGRQVAKSRRSILSLIRGQFKYLERKEYVTITQNLCSARRGENEDFFRSLKAEIHMKRQLKEQGVLFLHNKAQSRKAFATSRLPSFSNRYNMSKEPIHLRILPPY
jgi:hypothetical protein